MCAEAQPDELTITFTDRNFIRTRLPQGLVGDQNLVRVIGTVQSSSGAVTPLCFDDLKMWI